MSYPTIDATHKSPNHSPRNGAPITMLVLHATVGSGPSALAWLTSPASEVSTHYLIYKTGYIYQLVPDAQAAWHAGASHWFNLNSDDIREQSLGIELENANDGHDPYPDAQLASLVWLSRLLVAQYRIIPDMVVRHLDIATPKGRKTDPAGFPWAAWKAELYAAPAGDPFAKWGPIGKPQGAATGYATPKAWLMNQTLGACVVPETYSASGKYSVTEFVNGIIIYYQQRNAAIVELF